MAQWMVDRAEPIQCHSVHSAALGEPIIVRPHPSSDPGVRPIRVALIDMSPMLHGILSQLLKSQADIQVVPAPMIEEPRTADSADVFIMAAAGTTSRDAEAVLFARPRSAVVRITDRGHHTYVHTLQPTELALGSVSGEGLVDAIRRTVQRNDVVG